MNPLGFRHRLTDDGRWWVNFALVILAVLLIVGLLVLGWHTWIPDQVQQHGLGTRPREPGGTVGLTS